MQPLRHGVRSTAYRSFSARTRLARAPSAVAMTTLAELPTPALIDRLNTEYERVSSWAECPIQEGGEGGGSHEGVAGA
jgi:hypothetical protein